MTAPQESGRRHSKDTLGWTGSHQLRAVCEQIAAQTPRFEEAVRNGVQFHGSSEDPVGYKILQAAHTLNAIISSDDMRYRVFHNNNSDLFPDESNLFRLYEHGLIIRHDHEVIANNSMSNQGLRPDVLMIALAEVLARENPSLSRLPESIKNWRVSSQAKRSLLDGTTAYTFPIDGEVQLGIALSPHHKKKGLDPLPLSARDKFLPISLFVSVSDPEGKFQERRVKAQEELQIRKAVEALHTGSIARRLIDDIDPNALETRHSLEFINTPEVCDLGRLGAREVVRRLAEGPEAEYEKQDDDTLLSKNGDFRLRLAMDERAPDEFLPGTGFTAFTLEESEQFHAIRRGKRLSELNDQALGFLLTGLWVTTPSNPFPYSTIFDNLDTLVKTDRHAQDKRVAAFDGFDEGDLRDAFNRLFPLPQSVQDEIKAQSYPNYQLRTVLVENVTVGGRPRQVVFRLNPGYDKRGLPVLEVECWGVKSDEEIEIFNNAERVTTIVLFVPPSQKNTPE